MPTPKLPNTSSWTWICCNCSQANYRPSETSTYALCTACQHARCRVCSIRWRARTVEQEWTALAADSVCRYARVELSQQEYYALKQADEEYARSRGMETVWGWMERMKREGKWGRGRIGEGRVLATVCGVRGRELCSGGSGKSAGESAGWSVIAGDEEGERDGESDGDGNGDRGRLEAWLEVQAGMGS
ncbi:hypothetical protein JHW43_003506 [Diplocarpon mali]|nr:hypothetical protein JHW43_003506 [Diplocarpon mali]